MPASDDIIARAYLRAEGRCECELQACAHRGRCNLELQPGQWRGLILSELVPDEVSRCRAVCMECYQRSMERQSVMG